MERQQLVDHEESLKVFLHLLRIVTWCAIGSSLILFCIAIMFLYKKMLLSSMLVATFAYISFYVLQKYSVIMTKKWLKSRGGQEEVLFFLDKEMMGRSPREFFHLLERALKMVG